jgi:hypothetical protein
VRLLLSLINDVRNHLSKRKKNLKKKRRKKQNDFHSCLPKFLKH